MINNKLGNVGTRFFVPKLVSAALADDNVGTERWDRNGYVFLLPGCRFSWRPSARYWGPGRN